MTGGFIGVDVFFVISGYLISGIIIKQTKKEKFSYIDFYCRRIKRIYPALLLILAFVLYFVPKYYGPSELEFTLKTLNASTIFGANFQVLVHEKGVLWLWYSHKPITALVVVGRGRTILHFLALSHLSLFWQVQKVCSLRTVILHCYFICVWNCLCLHQH